MNPLTQTYIDNLFLNASSLYTWHLNDKCEFQDTDFPESTLMKNIFQLSPCYEFLKNNFFSCDKPILLYDDLFFLWCAIPELKDDKTISVVLLGPVFSSNTSEHFLKENMEIKKMSIKSQKTLLDLIQCIPVLPTAYFSHYIRQYFFVLNNHTISDSDIEFQYLSELAPTQRGELINEPHNTYYIESLILQNIENGILLPNFSSFFCSVPTGLMCPGNPIRQKKDESICCITLFTRAAIRGGYPAQQAYNLSDYYVQSIESADTISQITQLTETMYVDIVHRVQQIHLETISYNPLVRDCMAYIDGNLLDIIDLNHLAYELGYAKYYLTACFKKESGISINDYIKKRRIEYAKTLLQNPYSDIQDISESLHFSTPSYFSAVFKSLTGFTPSEYKETLKIQES